MSPGGKAPRARGDRFERLARASLEKHGWLVVRSGGSLGPADLLALRADHQPWMVSCKATVDPYLRPADMATLWHTAMNVNAIPVLAYKPQDGMAGVTFMCILAPYRRGTGFTPFKRLDHR